MANEFSISVSLSGLLPGSGAITGLRGGAFPNLAAAVRLITESAHQQWVAYAQGAPLPDGRSVRSQTGTYARSIQMRQLGEFQGEVFTELAYARTIEDGAPARDLHDILGRSLKVRLTKTGKRYLIIPFRSYQPNSVIGSPMPQAIHDWWRQVSRDQSSHITGMGWRSSGTGAVAFRDQTTGRFREVRGEVVQVRQRDYRWGAKLSHGDILSMGLGEKVAKRFAGMYRFDKPSQPGRHSQFIHFRVLMEGSSGWRVPARPGLHIAQTVARRLQPVAEEAFGRAMEADVRALLRSQD